MKNTMITRILCILLATTALPVAAHLTGVTSFGNSLEATSSSLPWTTDFNAALEQSKREAKPILLFFTGSDWCSWCTKLEKEVFETASFQQKAKDNYIFVELDFPSGKQLPQHLKEQNKSLQAKFGVKGYPSIVIVDGNGNRLAETGYKSGGGDAYAAHLATLVEPHLAKFVKSEPNKMAMISESATNDAKATTVE